MTSSFQPSPLKPTTAFSTDVAPFTSVTVLNVAPTVGAITVTHQIPPFIPVGDTVSVSATFTDPGTLDTHDCRLGLG